VDTRRVAQGLGVVSIVRAHVGLLRDLVEEVILVDAVFGRLLEEIPLLAAAGIAVVPVARSLLNGRGHRLHVVVMRANEGEAHRMTLRLDISTVVVFHSIGALSDLVVEIFLRLGEASGFFEEIPLLATTAIAVVPMLKVAIR